jgi:hypothetical protein
MKIQPLVCTAFIPCPLSGFHPEMVLLPNLFVGLRSCLCLPMPARQTGDVLQCVSVQPLVFLDLEQNASYPIWKLHSGHPAFPDGHYLAFFGDRSHKKKQMNSVYNYYGFAV